MANLIHLIEHELILGLGALIDVEQYLLGLVDIIVIEQR